MKVRVIANHPGVQDFMPFGFETELVGVRYEEDKQFFHSWDKRGEHPYAFIPKGTFKDINFIGSNGEVYGSAALSHTFGYMPISKIFEKI